MAHALPPHPPALRRKGLPRAAPVLLNLGDLVQIGGQLFVVGASLIPQGLAPAPVPVPVPVPTPVPGPVVPSPTVNEFRDPTRQFAVNQLVGGLNYWIFGSQFGAVPGTLSAATAKLPVLHWDDHWIQFTAPAYVPGAPSGMWTIGRADGTSSSGYYTFAGPAIVQPPPAGLNRE